MKKNILTVLVLLSTLNFGFTQKSYTCKKFKKCDSCFTSSEYSKGMFYDKSSGFLYKITNNDSMLAIDLLINDQIKQRKILMFGLTVWIDQRGKKKKNTGIMFPLGKDDIPGKKPMMSFDSDNRFSKNRTNSPDRLKNFPPDQFNKVKIISYDENISGIKDTREDKNIQALIGFNKLNIMYYRIEVPFSELGLNYELMKNSKISIGFETGHSEAKQMQNGPGGRPGNGPPPGGGGGRPNGGFPDKAGDMQMMQQKMSEKDKFWVKKVQLF